MESVPATNRGRPNIVLILIDDLGARDLGCYGSGFYETPHLDRLADEGALFSDAYAAAPVCSPTRASLLTGKYAANVGVTQYIGGHNVGELLDVPYNGFLPLHEYSLARALADGGYRTWHVGKWHLGSRRTWPDRHGFEINIGGCDWGHPQSYLSPYGCPTLSDGPDGEYLTDRLTDEAITLIESGGDEPFFLNLWHYAVHTPIQSPADLVTKYQQKAAARGLDRVDPIEVGEPLPFWNGRDGRVRRRIVQSDPAYAAMIENLDTNVGRLLSALDHAGVADNTIVIFTSDNGGLSTAEGSPTCNLPLAEGKGWMQEGGVRVPLIMRWPGVIRPGQRLSEPMTTPDFYPTLLAAADLPARPAQHTDGVDLIPLLRGKPFERGPIFWHYPHYSNQGGTPAAGVREGRWKLILGFETGRAMLFDLISDPGEHTDVADDQKLIAASLTSRLHEWLETVQVPIPRRNPHPEPYPDLPGSGA